MLSQKRKLRLVCTNESLDSGMFRTSLKIVSALLPLHKDKAGLCRLLEQDPVYQRMDEETARTVSVLMGVKLFMAQKENYKEGDGYNMCLAIREMMEDSRIVGEKAGWEKSEKTRIAQKAEGIRIFIQSHRDEGISDNSIAGRLQKYYDMTEDNAWAALKDGILYPQQ